MTVNNSFNNWQDYLGGILRNLLPLNPPSVTAPKVIHDPLWGSRLFYPWEVALLDTPLLQRLRQISQLGSAFLTYPSATHSRFSHSLGVCVLASRLINRLKEKAEILNQPVQITNKDIYTVRLSGLLHDVGHCFFSHCSEHILGQIIDNVIKESSIFDIHKKPKPHEFISYLIVTNSHFEEFWNKFIVPQFPAKETAPELKDIANTIVAIPPSPEKRYIQEIISGPYDVDKLEYLYRDAKMAGLEISYDIERYFYKISLYPQGNSNWRLVMDIGGVRAVEQIIFSKMMLYSFVYHHQKVLATDTLIIDLLFELLEQPPAEPIKVEHPLDFLKYTDFDLLARSTTGPSNRFNYLKELIYKRCLPKRCFILNKEFVCDLKNDDQIKFRWSKMLGDLQKHPQDIRVIRQKIVDEINSHDGFNATIDDVFINFPKLPSIDEPGSGPVLDASGQLTGVADYFDLHGWQRNYDLKKLRGYFFVSEHLKEIASDAIATYIDKEYGLKINNNAKTEAKISSGSPTI